MEVSRTGNASWPVQTLGTLPQGELENAYRQASSSPCKTQEIFDPQLPGNHGNSVACPLLNPNGLRLFGGHKGTWNKPSKICLSLRTLSLLLHNINCYMGIRVFWKKDRFALLRREGSRCMAKTPPKKHGIQEDNSPGIK